MCKGMNLAVTMMICFIIIIPSANAATRDMKNAHRISQNTNSEIYSSPAHKVFASTASITPSGSSGTYEACGVLTGTPSCTIFTLLGDDYFGMVLDNYGDYSIGDTVYVSGQYVPYCSSACTDSIGCLIDNTIGSCNSIPSDTIYYEGCGVLWEDFGCLLFFTIEPSIPPAVLDNYGSFSSGDTVFVSGIVYDCGMVCDTPGIDCIAVDSIYACNSNPSVSYRSCGYLYQGPLCLLFEPENFPDTAVGYRLDNYGSYVAGDTVFVDGWLEDYLLDDCEGVLYIVANNTIGECDSLPPDTFYYEGCGLLVDDTGCIRFVPYDYSFAGAVLTDYGVFNIGDEVYVSGLVDFECTDPCAYGPYVCLDNDSIITCDNDPTDTLYYEGCGVIDLADSCLLFYPFMTDTVWYVGPGPFEIGNFGIYGYGDTVYVSGMFTPDCTSGCPAATGCIFDNTIGECNGEPPDTLYYEGCGVLVDDTGCIHFYPFDSIFPSAILSDYGSFNIGDEVYVTGLYDFDCTDFCVYGTHVCLDNDTIISCDNNPSDTVYYEGCGVLVDEFGCVRFHPYNGFFSGAVLSDYGLFDDGDEVYVSGLVNFECTDSCAFGSNVCVDNDTITTCESDPSDSIYYFGCGVLVDDTGCIHFHPYDTIFPSVVLSDYDSFNVGDEVYVAGMIDFGCTDFCAYGTHACLINDSIMACNSVPNAGCGNANGDCCINIFDITFIIGYLYLEGQAPEPLTAADVDGNGEVNLFDITYLIRYLYLEGTLPACR